MFVEEFRLEQLHNKAKKNTKAKNDRNKFLNKRICTTFELRLRVYETTVFLNDNLFML